MSSTCEELDKCACFLCHKEVMKLICVVSKRSYLTCNMEGDGLAFVLTLTIGTASYLPAVGPFSALNISQMCFMRAFRKSVYVVVLVSILKGIIFRRQCGLRIHV